MNARMDTATALRMSALALTDASRLPASIADRRELARHRYQLRERLALLDERIINGRRRVRQAHADLPDGQGYGSGPDEYDSLLIDAFELSVDLLRQAYRERGKVRRELGVL